MSSSIRTESSRRCERSSSGSKTALPGYGWLNENVHEHGCQYTTPDLIEEATGESFTAEYFLEYVTEKYGDLYEL